MIKKYYNKLEIEGVSKGNFENGIIVYPWKIQLDAGYYHSTGKDINMVIITHGHADHIKRLPDIVMNNTSKVVTIVADDGICHRIDKFLVSFLQLNHNSNYVDKNKYYNLVPYSKYAGEIILEQFKVSHSVPTNAYGIIRQTKQLKQEYKDLTHEEIKQLAIKKITVSEKINQKYILYATDFEEKSLADLPLNEYQYVIMECTFFFDDHYIEAVKRKHLHWKMIQPYLKSCKETKFILMHMSQRYKDEDMVIINEMIKEYDNCCLFE